ncbi:MAG: hypothetical protein WCK31_03320 [bacterium]
METNKIVERIKKESQNKDLYIVGISGFGGAGKTYTAKLLAKELGDTNIVSIDSFSSSFGWKRDSEWSNFDRKKLIEKVITPAKKKHWPIKYESITWPESYIMNSIIIQKKKILIIEGCSIFHPDMKDIFDLKIWIKSSLGNSTENGKERDVKKNNDKNIGKLWDNIFMPNEKDFYNKYKPDKAADIVITNQTTA